VKGIICIAPAICALVHYAWHRIALPQGAGLAWRSIADRLWRATLVSLGLASVVALTGSRFVQCMWLVSALTVMASGLQRMASGALVRRYVSTFLLIMPVFLHYRLLAWWIRHAELGQAEAQRAYSELHATYARLLVQRLMELGGLFVKLGQLCSLFSNLGLPAEYLRELKRLQSEVTAVPGAEIRRLVSEALGRPLEEVFSHFEDSPLGSASLGQVHRARVAADGRDVAVKVQNPQVAASLAMDFDWILWLARRAKPEEERTLLEVKRAFLRELDFAAEARTLQRVHASLRAAFPSVRVPAPVPELCSSKVIVMTFVPGVSILDSLLRMAAAVARLSGTSVEDLFAAAGKAARDLKPGEEVANAYGAPVGTAPKAGKRGPSAAALLLLACRLASLRVYQALHNAGVDLHNRLAIPLGTGVWDHCRIMPTFDPVKVSRTAWRVQGHQLFVDGFFNTDSHPGNFLVDPRTGEVGLIDFGQVCDLRLETRVRFARLVVALTSGCEADIAAQHARLGIRTRYMRSEQLALHARLKFGKLTTNMHNELQRRVAALDSEDPVLSFRSDAKMALVEKMVMLLRGTNVFLGVLGKHNAQTMWLDMAQDLLAQHGASYPEEEVLLDLDAAPAKGAATAPRLPPAAWTPPPPAAPALESASLGFALLGAQWLGTSLP